MYICEWKAIYFVIKHDFQATEKIIFDGMLEQPMTYQMTQCASELNQIKYFIFKTIVVLISTCTLSYLFCMLFRCGSTCYMPKFTKQTNFAQEWVEWYKMTVSCFTSELFYSWKLWHRVKYGLDYFLNHFLTIFWTTCKTYKNLVEKPIQIVCTIELRLY